MKVSRNWLQTYFKDELPTPEKLVDLLTFHAFDIEGLEKLEHDAVLDIKVLPDRACYSLSHRGIAKELHAIGSFVLNDKKVPTVKIGETRDIKITIEDGNLCRRHIGRIVEGIKVEESPAWLKERLASLGQRSINNIVDATNFVMLDMGQPLHAFDADKIKGEVCIRAARNGEKLVTLDGKDLVLDSTMIVVADEDGPLDIAGIKGGKKAELDSNTKNILLSSANFNPTNIRRTSFKTGVRTDAAKRFENSMTPEYAEPGLEEVTALIASFSNANISIGKNIDVYPIKSPVRTVKFDAEMIDARLGLAIPEKEMFAILSRLNIETKKEGSEFVSIIPADRSDLTVAEDMVEEIGRIYGYEKIKGVLPPKLKATPLPNKILYYTEKIKNILLTQGFSEVYLYTLVPKGDIEITKPLASDKSHLRNSLTDGMKKCIETNTLNAPLLGLDKVKIFEIGKVFDTKKESWSLVVGGACVKEAFERVGVSLGVELKPTIKAEGKIMIGEIILDSIFEKLPEAASYEDLNFTKASDSKYQKFSLYPFIVRDIALFVPKEVMPEEVVKVINEISTNLLLKGPTLFDDFTNKEGKHSLAFRMIYQSMERTLSDAEVNEIMEKVYEKVKAKGWEVR
ncbi:MAG: phenylalanine--tRNA ligase subunit beta [Candidatus Taylorbacteria bacterium]|nr:phenylalanine--tRNA ligase subunit beta [Candidatus Taylorbacteria bacterium]